MLADHDRQGFRRPLPLLGRLVRKNRLVLQKLARAIHRRHLAARAKARIHAQGRLHPRRGRQQQVFQIRLKGLDGHLIGPGFFLGHHFAGEGRLHQAAVGVLDQRTVKLAQIRHRGFDRAFGDGLQQGINVDVQAHLQHPLPFAPQQGQQVVGGHRPHRSLIGPIHFVFGAAFGMIFFNAGGDLPLLQQLIPHIATQIGPFRHLFRQNIRRPLQSLLHRSHALFGVDKPLSNLG